MTNIETALKALIDATTWLIGVELVTKTTYIWVESHAKGINLDKPPVTNTDVIFVIKPSVRTQPFGKSFGATVYQWNGDLELHAFNLVDMQRALDLIKTIGDSDINLTLFIPGAGGRPLSKFYLATIVYQWNKFESDT